MTEQTEEKTEEKTQVDIGAIEERARRFEAQLIDANKRLEKFAGIDVEKYHAVLEDYDNLRKEKATGSREEIDALIEDKRKEIEGAYKTHLDEAKNKSLTLEKELKQLRVVDRAKTKAAVKFNEDALDLIQNPIERDLDFIDGAIVVRDAGGELRRSPNDPSKNMDLDEYLDELASRFPSIVKSDYRGGGKPTGQTKSAGGQSSGITTQQYLNMTPNERRQLDTKTRGELARRALGINR